MRLTILHTNDIHGRQERIAQIAAIVRREKETSPHRVLYLDAGDVEETTNRLSSATKGTAMHRLLSLTTCDAATVGNACWLRYGPGVLADHARAASYPLLLANFTGIEGPVPSVLLDGVGVFGLTAPFQGMADDVPWGFERADILETARACARDLRARGAEIVVLLSHLGLDVPAEPWDDRSLAPELRGLVDVIVGAHTHDLLPDGEVIGGVLVTQAGCYGEHIGRIEIDGEWIGARVDRIPDELQPDPAIAEEAAAIEREIEAMLAEPIGEIDVLLDAEFVARVLRDRMQAEVGLFSEGQTLGVVPPGELTRGLLWGFTDSPANPGVTQMSGAQLIDLIARANAPEMQRDTPTPLRGRARGRLAFVGPAELRPERRYVVAATDWELEPYGGHALPQWNLRVSYDFPIIVREVVEEHLRGG